MKVLFIGDGLEGLNLKSDTSLCLAQGCLEMGLEVHWATSSQLGLYQDHIIATQPLNIKLVSLDKVESQTVDGDAVPLEKYGCVFLRKDPPFDNHYLNVCWLLSMSSVPCFNKPQHVAAFHEKILHLALLNRGYLNREDIIPTLFKCPPSLLNRFMEVHNEGHGFIVKPWLGYGGKGINHFKSPQDVVAFLNDGEEWNSGSGGLHTQYMVQPFDPSVKSVGDRRVLYVFGEPIGDCVRIPKEGRFEANLAQGASAIHQRPSQRTQALINKIGNGLKKLNIAFAGADIIGNRVNEINITSPTGLRTIENLTNRSLSTPTIKMLLAMAGVMGCVSKKQLVPEQAKTDLMPFEMCHKSHSHQFVGYVTLQGEGSFPFELFWSGPNTAFEVTDPLGSPLLSIDWSGENLKKKDGVSFPFIDELNVDSVKKVFCGGINLQSQISSWSQEKMQGTDLLNYKSKNYKFNFEVIKKSRKVYSSIRLEKSWWALFNGNGYSIDIFGKIKGSYFVPRKIRDATNQSWELTIINEGSFSEHPTS